MFSGNFSVARAADCHNLQTFFKYCCRSMIQSTLVWLKVTFNLLWNQQKAWQSTQALKVINL
jgi:hypothetical protein